MKKPLIALAAAAAVVAFAVQISLPPALAGHATKLKDAQSFKAKLLVNEVGGAQSTVEVLYGKPGSFKIDSPQRLVVSDGKTLTVLDKAKNTYTQTEADKAAPVLEASQTAVWAWLSFFEADPAKVFKSARAGADRKFRNVDTTEVEVVSLDGKTTATVFVDKKLGVARGAQVAKEDKQFIVFAETLQVGAEPAAAAEFAFTPPAGATKLEQGAANDVTWSQVATVFNRTCLPCHSAQLASGRLNITSYETVMASKYVVPGEANNSILARSLRAAGAKRMPQGRPPLPESQIKLIEDWINGGAKQ